MENKERKDLEMAKIHRHTQKHADLMFLEAELLGNQS